MLLRLRKISGSSIILQYLQVDDYVAEVNDARKDLDDVGNGPNVSELGNISTSSNNQQNLIKIASKYLI